MAISRVSSQDTAASSATTSVVGTYAGKTTTGNLLIAYGIANGSTLTISGSGTWTTLVSGFGSSATQPMKLFYKLADGTETSLTASSTGATLMSLSMVEYTGVSAPILTDGLAASQNNSGTSVTTYTTPLITTQQPNDLIFCVLASSAATAFSWVTSTLVDANTSGTFHIYGGENIVALPQTNFQDTANWTGGHQAASMIAAFRPPKVNILSPNRLRPHPFSPGLAR